MCASIEYIDICCGLNWGDEAKGKIISHLARNYDYDFVCRWAGGNNAGHTVYVDGKKYKTHLIPCGIFYNRKSIIGPDCVINQEAFQKELKYLQDNGFNIDLIRVSPKANVILDKHIEDDKKHYGHQGTTSKGIAPCYRDKYARVGTQAKDIPFFKPYLWDEQLRGKVLCEGAQGYWLDINQGNYPYTTSSVTLPYGACSLGFPPQLIRKIFGATKIYDTRSGTDPLFPEELLDDPELLLIAKQGEEYGTTTGRPRKVNWLDLDKLIEAVNTTGTTVLIMSKLDVLTKVNNFKLFHNNETMEFNSIKMMTEYISKIMTDTCKLLDRIVFSDDPEKLVGV